MDCRPLRFLRGLGGTGRCYAEIFAGHKRTEAPKARAHCARAVLDVPIRGQANCNHRDAHGIIRGLNFPESDERHS